MKKSILLVLMLIFSLILVSCGGKEAAPAEAAVPKAEESASGAESTPAVEASANTGIYKEAGSELGDFTNALVESEKIFEDPINACSSVPLDPMMARVTPNLALLTAPQYDLLSFEDEAKEQGKLMLGGYEGVREKNGGVIKFSGKQVYEEDGVSGNKKGDVYSEQGSLDTKTNTFIYESKLERGGQVLNRIVFEAVILPDGTYLIQYIDVSHSSSEPETIYRSAVFKRYNGSEYTAVIADFDGDTDFSYDSIAGKGDVKAEDMAKNYNLVGKFVVSGGVASYEK